MSSLSPITPPDQTATPAVPFHSLSTRARILRIGYRTGAIVRVTFALGLVLGWVALALPGASRAWLQAAGIPANTGPSLEVGHAPPGDASLYTLLLAAHTSCPPPQDLLLLSDDERSWQRGNYLLYPQRMEVVLSTAPLDPAWFTTHAGGCVFYYGPQGTRLAPFHDRLTQLACSADGCLFRISK